MKSSKNFRLDSSSKFYLRPSINFGMNRGQTRLCFLFFRVSFLRMKVGSADKAGAFKLQPVFCLKCFRTFSFPSPIFVSAPHILPFSSARPLRPSGDFLGDGACPIVSVPWLCNTGATCRWLYTNCEASRCGVLTCRLRSARRILEFCEHGKNMRVLWKQ